MTTLIVGAAILAIIVGVTWPLLPKQLPARRSPTVRLAAESTLAREKAERDLAAVRAETPRYRALGDDLRALEPDRLAVALVRSMQTRGS